MEDRGLRSLDGPRILAKWFNVSGFRKECPEGWGGGVGGFGGRQRATVGRVLFLAEV